MVEAQQQAQQPAISRIDALAAAIGQNTATVSDYLHAHGKPFPSFEHDAPVDPALHDDPAAEWARQKAIMDARTLIDLLQGPQMCLRPCYNAFPLQAIYKFRIAQHVPLTPPGSSISFTDLAAQTNLYEPDLRRIIRHAILYHRCFQEPTRGRVAHSAASLQLATNDDVQHGIGLMFDDFYQSFARTAEALESPSPSSPLTPPSSHGSDDLQLHQHQYQQQPGGPEKSGWALAHGGQSIFETLKADPARAARFSGAMKFFSATVPGNNPAHLLDAYPWHELPAGATVVDVGGADGYVGALIAQAHPGLQLVCQDLPHVAAAGVVPADLQGRMRFVAQDFFEEQAVKGADVYLLRWILHDWADAYVVRILRNLIPALKKGARVVINDNVGPGQSGCLPEVQERFVREIDSLMLAAFNSYEREREDWERVVREASPRFGEVKVRQIEGALLAVMEVEWLGE